MDIGSILKDIWYGMLDVCWMIGEHTPGASYIREIVKEGEVWLVICNIMATRLMPLFIYVYYVLVSQEKEYNKDYIRIYEEGRFTEEHPKEYYERKIKETGEYVRSPKRVIIFSLLVLSEILFIYMIL